MSCPHPSDRLAPFLRELGRPQVYECLECGALIEKKPRLEGIGYEYIVVQDRDE